MFHHATIRILLLTLVGCGPLFVPDPAKAQQGWPINGSNWSFYGGSRDSSPYSPSYPSGPPITYRGYSYALPYSGYFFADGAYSPIQRNTAHIRLVVPGDATVWFGNAQTKQGGEIRHFESPALTPEHEYVYEIKVRWRNKDGQEVTRTRQLNVAANGYVSVDFTRQ
jgi:uncharacterized protein (TIGR03000 family)